jgi:eukaryotic-like serine/threonine-protein kinase
MNESADPDRTGHYLQTVTETPVPEMPPPSHPERIGHYRIERLLGKGGFGLVYLAHDEHLDRLVAIKLPHPRLVSRPEDAELYLAEARTAAMLSHPHITSVYYADSTEAHPFYCVAQFIEGTTLAKRMAEGPFSYHESAELVATVAEALHYAHGKGVFHRDIKPGNILLDMQGNPYVADFGLALREEDVGKGPRHVGTPAYMSPEQALGEGHRVDGRADIFSLGVVFYELLTRRRPFQSTKEDPSEAKSELYELIVTHDPRPPRQFKDDIPKELERICLKALSKRTSDRYTTARDMAEELRAFCARTAPVIQGPSDQTTTPSRPRPPEPTPGLTSGAQPVRIIPKGLRSFDGHDKDFFLELLPGPRDRDGLPDSIRFWKTRIEERDPDNTFAVGLIYGPSGCGKTSLVRAGLLPRLSEDVVAVYCEAAAEETEARLLNGLGRRFPALAGYADLKEALSALRRGRALPAGKKVLLVIDQFEQWLHANRQARNPELVQALRQCDGGRVQCVVMVRDDFWLASSRFMRDLEIRLVEGQNSALVDLFDVDHAKKVLAAFGRAYGRLPEKHGETTRQQKDFLKQAVEGLATEGKIVCVRLALFAEMMKSKPWTPARLKEMGGTQGVGEAFLEESLISATAPPQHRYHQGAARSVLKALLPEAGTDIKGHMRSDADLLRASGYAGRPRDFEDLMRILDGELRLITPINPEETESGEKSGEWRAESEEKLRETIQALPEIGPGPSTHHSLLTTRHDWQVKSEEKLQETIQASPETGPAPSTDHSSLSTSHYQLTHDYLVPSLRDWLTQKQREKPRGRAELLLAERATAWEAKPERRLLPGFLEWLNIRLLTRKRDWTPAQKKMMGRAGIYYGIRSVALAAALVLMALSAREFLASLHARALADRLLVAAIADVPAVVTDMDPYRRWVDPLLRREYGEAAADKRLRLGIALLPSDSAQVDYLYEGLLAAKPEEFAVVRGALSPYKDPLLEGLWAELENRTSDTDRRFRAACALAGYTPKDPRLEPYSAFIVEKLVRENALVLNYWKEALQPVGESLLSSLASVLQQEKVDPVQRCMIAQVYIGFAGPEEAENMLSEKDRPTAPVDAKVAAARRRAAIGAALVAMDRAEKVWPLLIHSNDPTLRSYLIERLEPAGVSPRLLLNQISLTSNASVRLALILALGSFERDSVPSAEAELLKLYENHPDPGIHGASGWVLGRWGIRDRLRQIDKKLMTGRADVSRRWYVNKQGQTFVIVAIPSRAPSDRSTSDVTSPIARKVAIAATEVTVDDFRRWKHDHEYVRETAPTGDCPVNSVSWYLAAEYCNWLSSQEGIPEDQWCYARNAAGKYEKGMRIATDCLKRAGYRLPTDAEWEFACRAGSRTGWSCGEVDSELVGNYAWWYGNSQQGGSNRSFPVGTLKPNDFGLFDMHGNIYEWCQDTARDNAGDRKKDRLEAGEVKDDVKRVVRSGSFHHLFGAVRSDSWLEVEPKLYARATGLRPARTLP